MSDFRTVATGTAPVSDGEASEVFRVLAPILMTADGDPEAREAAASTIARMSSDSLAGVVLDWWLVVTTGSAPPLGHAFHLPDRLPHRLRDAMERVVELTNQGLSVPAGRWILASRSLNQRLDELGDYLHLDHYGTSKLSRERDVWAYLQDQLAPTVDALRSGQPAIHFNFDERTYCKEMKQNGIDEGSRRWKEMLKRASTCVSRVNDAVALQGVVEPWVGRSIPEPLTRIPPEVAGFLGPNQDLLLAYLVEPDNQVMAEANLVAVAQLEEIAQSMDESGRSWLATLADEWLATEGLEVASLVSTVERRKKLAERVATLQGSGADTDEIELLLLDHNLEAAENAAGAAEDRRRQDRRGAAVRSTIAKLSAPPGDVDQSWLDRLTDAAAQLDAGDLSAAEQAVHALDREFRVTQRAGAMHELEQLAAELDRLDPPVSMVAEVHEHLEDLRGNPDRTVDHALLGRTQQRLEALTEQRRREIDDLISSAHDLLESDRDLIDPDALDGLELRLAEVESERFNGEVMTAADLAADLMSEIDGQRVRRWSASDGEADLVDHLIDFCTQELHFDSADVRRLFVAAKTKPFVILAGLTGSGKSTIARLFAGALGADAKNGRFRRIAVRPDWIDQTEVLGSVHPLSNQFEPGWLAEVARQCERNPDQIHVVLLDEMNLAPVEQYLAEFLSAIEEARSGAAMTTLPLYPAGASPANSREWPPSLPFPVNLIVIGTVNVDETTRVLSERVLDRANVLQLSVEISDAHHQPRSRSVRPWFVPYQEWQTICTDQPDPRFHGFLVDLADILQLAGIGVGQRAHVELERFVANSDGILDATTSLDLGILQRVIPKIRGFKRDLAPALTDLRDELDGKSCRRSVAVLERWLDDRIPDDEFLDGTDARIGLIRG